MRDLDYRVVDVKVYGKTVTSKRFGVRVGVFPKYNGKKAWYARLVEFGAPPHRMKRGFHPGARKKPFLFPAFWSLRKRIKSRINRAMLKAAKESVSGSR